MAPVTWSQMAREYEVQSDLPAMRWQGAVKERLPDMQRATGGFPYRSGGRADSGRGAERFAPACGRQGQRRDHGAAPGDLYITTHVEPHPLFNREGDNIHMMVPVTIAEAGLGAKIEVPTI